MVARIKSIVIGFCFAELEARNLTQPASNIQFYGDTELRLKYPDEQCYRDLSLWIGNAQACGMIMEGGIERD